MKEIVIKIPEEIYNSACATNNTWNMRMAGFVCSAIANGKVLPKGHKELIDTKELIQDFIKAEENMKDNGVAPVFDAHEITNLILAQDVLVDADKEAVTDDK